MIKLRDKVFDFRCNYLSELSAVENAIVTRARLLPMGFSLEWDSRQQALSSLGLAMSSDVIQLTFDRHQGWRLDRGHV